MLALKLLTFHWFSSLFCQSFFLHRYCSHQMFKMNFFWERFFYLMTYLTQGPSFLNPRSYAVMHNRHHQFSDTTNDPHTPVYSNNIWSMMLKTYRIYMNILEDDQSKKQDLYPQWPKLDAFAESKLGLVVWLIIYPAVYYLLEIPFVFYILLPIHFLVGPIQGAIVNWFGHRVGYRNYALPDQSKNTLPMDFLLMGELYQNNHHRFGKKLNFAHRFFEIDLTYQMIRVLKLLGIIDAIPDSQVKGN